ncbi:DUF58 domain-containing protein [Rossellomorea marisflavi]|uniref:DUF58 domain-containing protein n=1 Tax=Rossellomorea marisflavi TaxID=189381 RepID=UPI004044248F
MTKSSRNLLGRLLFQDKGILPTGKLLMVLGIASILLVIAGGFGLPWPLVFMIDGLLIALSLCDLLLSPKKKEVGMSRQIENQVERCLEYKVDLHIHNASHHEMLIELKDGLPQVFEARFPLKGKIPASSSLSGGYSMVAPVRGDYNLSRIYLRYRSRLGLWAKQKTFETDDAVRVIPDLTETRKVLEDAQQYLMYEGQKIRKQKSGSGEFAKIRTYVTGDDPRMINWRQTAKLQEVMTNEYEPEHGKYITILIDCGRMMGAELKKGNRLEKSLEAAMTVAAAALKNGDYVSVIAFSREIKVYVPPAKGMAHMQTILEQIYSLQVDAAESNYALVFQHIQSVQRKRSLLLLFSDVHTFLNEDSLLFHFQRLRRQHLFLTIGVEDETVMERSKDEPVGVKAAMIKSMAQQQIMEKRKEKMKWEKQGLHMLEAREEKLASTAVSHYIDVLNRGLL